MAEKKKPKVISDAEAEAIQKALDKALAEAKKADMVIK